MQLTNWQSDTRAIKPELPKMPLMEAKAKVQTRPELKIHHRACMECLRRKQKVEGSK